MSKGRKYQARPVSAREEPIPKPVKEYEIVFQKARGSSVTNAEVEVLQHHFKFPVETAVRIAEAAAEGKAVSLTKPFFKEVTEGRADLFSRQLQQTHAARGVNPRISGFGFRRTSPQPS
jgi:hypothetical protein